MAKKLKESHKKPNPNSASSRSNAESNSSSIFESLFGEIPESSSTVPSIFSSDNPFRRKPGAVSHTPINQLEEGQGQGQVQQELGSIENAKIGGLEKKSESVEVDKRKRKKEKKGNLDSEPNRDDKKLKHAEFDKAGLEIELKAEGEWGISNSGGSAKKRKEKKKEKLGKGVEKNAHLVTVFRESAEMGKGTSDNLGVENGIEEKMNQKLQRKKRKRDEVEAEYEAKRYGVVAGDEVKGEELVGGAVVGEKRKKMDNPEDSMVTKDGFDDESKLLRTIFVGNLPLKIKKKSLIKEFGKFGEVESIRIRSVPIVDSKTPRKGAIIKKQINDKADSVHAYVVFKSEESAKASLTHNMAVIGGNHIRVDRACPPRKKLKGENTPLYDTKRTVFVGNLPYDVKDEEIYQLFSDMKNLESSIEAVRVVRDPNMSLGKGIAYVLFKTRDAANLVVKKHNLKLRDRDLRLCHAKANSTPSKRKSSFPEDANNSPAKRIAALDSRTPGSKNMKMANPPTSYQGLQASKSRVHKKAGPRSFRETSKSKANPQKMQQTKERQQKRPAVAARKANALKKAAAASKQMGTKRKFEKRTPDSSRQKKKARRS